MGVISKFLRLFRISAIVFGPLALVAATVFAVKTELFLGRASTAAAMIVALDTGTDSDGDLEYYPEFTFSTANEKTVTVRSSTGSNPAGYHVGERTKVFYDPARPADARLEGFVQIWFVPCCLGLIGALFTGVGAAFWWREKRLGQPE